MLVIPESARPHFIKVITEATNRGLLHRLLPFLTRLNAWGDETGEGQIPLCTNNCVLGYDGAAMSFSISWVRPGATEAWMHGGLIFHPDYSGDRRLDTGSWSIHT